MPKTIKSYGKKGMGGKKMTKKVSSYIKHLNKSRKKAK